MLYCKPVALLIITGVLLSIAACHPHKPQPLPADAVVQMGPEGTPRRVTGAHLAADLESTAAYEDARKGADFAEMARLFLVHRSDLFKLADPRADLHLIAVQADGLGHHHAKFQQVVTGIPVWLKTISLHFDPTNRLYRVDGDYLPTPIAVDTQPALTAAEAQTKALQGIAGTGGGWKVETSELIVFADAGAEPRLAYRLTVAKGLTGREDRIVAADSGQVLKRLSRINP